MVTYDEVKNAILFIKANKQDAAATMSLVNVTHQLGLHSLTNNWDIQASCAVTGEGLSEGFHWITRQLQKAKCL